MGGVGVKVLLEEFSVITVVGLVLEKTVLIGKTIAIVGRKKPTWVLR